MDLSPISNTSPVHVVKSAGQEGDMPLSTSTRSSLSSKNIFHGALASIQSPKLGKRMMGGSYQSLHALPVNVNEETGEKNKAEKVEAKRIRLKGNNEEEQEHATGTKQKRSSSLSALLRLTRKKRQEQEPNDQEVVVEDTSSGALSASPVSQTPLNDHLNNQSRMPAIPRPTSQSSLTVDSPRTHRRKSVQQSDTPRPRRSTSPHPRPRGDFSPSPRAGKKKSVTDAQRSERKSDSQRSERISDSQRSERMSDSQRSERYSDSQRSERISDASRSERISNSSRSERISDSQRSEGKGDRHKKGGSSKKKPSSKKKKEAIDDGEKIQPKKPSSKRKARSLSTDLKVVEELEKEDESIQQKRKARSLSAEIQVHGEQDEKELQTANDPKDGDTGTSRSRSERRSESPNVKSKRFSQRLAERLAERLGKSPPSSGCDDSDDEDGATGSKKGKKKRFRKARSESPNVKTKGLSQRLQERMSRSAHELRDVKKERGRSESPGTQKKRLSKKVAEKFELVSFLSPPGRKAKTVDRSDSPGKRKKEKSRSKSPWKLKDRLRRSKSPGKHNQRLSDTGGTQGQDNAANNDEDAEVKALSPKSVRSLDEDSGESRSLEEYKESSVGVFVSPGRRSIKAQASTEEFRSSTVGVIVSPGRNSPKVMASPRVRKKTITEKAENDSSATPATKRRPSWRTLLEETTSPSQPPQIPQRQHSPDSNGSLSHVHNDETLPLKDSNDERQDFREHEGIGVSMRSMESLGSAGRRSSRRSSRSLASNVTETSPEGPQSMWSMDSKTITPKTGNQQKRKVDGTNGDKRAAIPAPTVAPKAKGTRKKTAPKMKDPSSPDGSTFSVEEPYVRSTPVSPGAGVKIKFNPRGKRPVTKVPVKSKSVPAVSSSGKQQREQSPPQKQRLRRLPLGDDNKDLSSNPSFPKDDDDQRSSHALERKNSSRSLPAPPIRQNSLELIEKDKVPEMPNRRVSTNQDTEQERKYMESVREDEAVTGLPGKAFRRASLDDHFSDFDDESVVDSNNQLMFSSFESFSASYGSLTLGGGESLSSDDTLRNRSVFKKSSNQNDRKNGKGSILKQKQDVEKPGSGSKYSMVSLAPQSTVSLNAFVGRIHAGPRTKSNSRSTRSYSPGSQPGS